MRLLNCCCLVFFVGNLGWADSPELPLNDRRLSVSSLVREDVFSGWRTGNMDRFARAERNLDKLLESRPDARADVLVWQGATKLYRAILAFEADDTEGFEKYYQQFMKLNQAALAADPNAGVVKAVVGGGYVFFADRLPAKYRAEAWEQCYQNYQALWKSQSKFVARLPRHIGGELLAGLVQSSQRTGRTEEFKLFLNKTIEVLPDTHYARIAQQWKDDPQAAANGNISCKYCHGPGRLAARINRLKDANAE